jgi:2-C-methyl-D-erythritol 4-phosphate cytidylyltransferase
MAPIHSTSLEDIRDQINTNLLGAIYVAKASIKYLKETKGSLILFTSSSYTRGRENYSPYSSSKAGVVNFTQALADEVNLHGIRVNSICPERTDTPMRKKNFGFESKKILLDPKKVALVTLKTALSDITGQVVDVRRK